MNADGAAPASSTGWAPAGALCGQGPVPHRLRSIARGREALLRGRARALVFGSAEFSAEVHGMLEPLGYECASVVPGGREMGLLLQLVAAAGPSWQLFVCELVLSTPEGHAALQVAREVRKASPLVFIVVCGAGGAASAAVRLACFEIGANMVTRCRESLKCVATVVGSHGLSGGRFRCVTCGMGALTEDELWEHYPTFHVNHPSVVTECPVCGKKVGNFAVHLRNDHGPPGRGEIEAENRKQIALYSFALVVCRHPDGRLLLVQEFCNQGFWLPGGAVDPRESLCAAAVRETKEEAGIDITLTGVLKIEHSGRDGYVRLRTIFAAEPVNPDQLPKSVPDYESAGAAWASPEEIASLRLRGPEPLKWCRYLEEGGAVYPLSILDDRGTAS